jgi:hypothetical protein
MVAISFFFATEAMNSHLKNLLNSSFGVEQPIFAAPAPFASRRT